MSSEIIEAKPHSVAPARQQAATPSDLVRYAIDNGADIDKLEKLMSMQVLWEEREARKAYVAAMAEFKRNPPEIVKTKLVEFSGTSYKHATLGDVAKAVIEALARHGFSHRWDVSQPGDGRIIVKCVITHDAGHSETNAMESGADVSGKKNSIQSIASACTYLQRYTLLAAVGLATVDESDDDGRSATRDYTMQNEWVTTAMTAEKDELDDVWRKGAAAFRAANDIDGHNAFKAAIVARHAALREVKNG